jgi:hypothetical protein
MDISWLIEMGATPAVIIVFIMGVMFAAGVILVLKQFKADNKILRVALARSNRKYHLLNTNFVRLADRVDPSMVIMHHSTDYTIRHPLDKPRPITDKFHHD